MEISDNVPQLVETRTCSECGTIIHVFDPPLCIDEADPCQAISPNNRPCELPIEHDGKHLAIIEETESWE